MSACSPGNNNAGTPTHFAASTKAAPSPQQALLIHNLAALDQESGAITGTITVGSDVRPLTGSVTLNGTATQIEIDEGDKNPLTFAEIVVKGHRYTSHDGKIWTDRGAKAVGTGLRNLLANADTDVDSGVFAVGGISAHKFLTAPDMVDVAPALGLDTWAFDQETTTLRVWSDDSSNPIGFGASMSWKLLMGGVNQDVAVELDVIFGSNPPSAIAAPSAPWPWKEDRPTGIAFSYPGGQAQVNTTVTYTCASVGNEALPQATKDIVDAMADTPSGTKTILIDYEDASWMTVRRSAANDFAVIAIVVHEAQACQFVIAGRPADQAGIEAQAAQVLSTVEFTR